MPSNTKVLVSVIIPHYANVSGLRACVRAIRSGLFPTEQVEIIVVDNGSPPEQRERLNTLLSDVQIVDEHRSGSYAARNAGVRVANASTFAFTDSDCIPDPCWLSAAVSLLRCSSPETVIAGHVEMVSPAEEKLTRYGLYDLAVGLDQKRYVEIGGFAITANMVTSRELFSRIGPFNDQLKSGGDRDWSHRAQTVGAKIVYTPEIIVRHQVRNSRSAVKKKVIRITDGVLQLKKAGNDSPAHPGETFVNRIMRVQRRQVLHSLTDWFRFLTVCVEVLWWQRTAGRKTSRER